VTKIARRLIVLLALLAAGLSFPTQAAAFGGGFQASQQEKLNGCQKDADKRGLKGDHRKKFMQDCMNKSGGDRSLDDVSKRDKMNTCKNLADKRNLKGVTVHLSLRTASTR
jgi:hypothetical protein